MNLISVALLLVSSTFAESRQHRGVRNRRADSSLDFSLGCQLAEYRMPGRILVQPETGYVCSFSPVLHVCMGSCETSEIPMDTFPHRQMISHRCVPSVSEVKLMMTTDECEEGSKPFAVSVIDAIECKCMNCTNSEEGIEGVPSCRAIDNSIEMRKRGQMTRFDDRLMTEPGDELVDWRRL